jgi:hypothetical protein
MLMGNDLRFIRGWKAIAGILNVTVEHLRIWHKIRPLPISRIGRGKNASVLIEERDLLRWVKIHRRMA